MLGCTRLICGTAAVLLAGAGLFENALGRPNIRQSFFNAYPQAVGSRLDNLPSIQGHCGVCHYAFTGGGTRNAFGVALGNVLGNFPNNDAGRQAAIHSIENEDSDSDGYAQLVEITDTQNYDNTPTFPGLTPANVGQVSQVDPADILGYLVPSSGTDTEPPDVVLLTPNGGEVWTAGTVQTISWIATDDTEVSTVDLSYRDHGNEAWHFLARRLSNTGSLTWSVPNLPSTDAAVRIQARDLAGNVGSDESDQPFTILPSPGGTVPTTLRDFEQPGSQPFDAEFFSDRTACSGCHGGYDPAVEPDHGFQGSMMAQAARDPLFFACLTIAEQDAPSSGDLCLRCHTPFGWLGGRSNPTTGELLTASDRDGVSCHFCHRMVDPIYDSGIDPPEDVDVLAGIADVPGNYANGQYVADPEDRRRGPFEDAAAPHTFLASAFHRSSDFCGTCHDVSNPVFERVGGSDYAPGPLDEPPNDFDSSVLLPLERTYSEWKNSEFATTGVYAPEFAGNKPDGIVSTCQDCHMADAQGRGCNVPGTPLRDDLPRHDLTGGNAWVPSIVEQAYPGEVDAQALADGAQRAISMLERAALLDVAVDPEPNGYLATVTITNRSGHKLPTGYPEGRRMWVSLAAYDAADQIIYESGAYDPGTGILVEDDDLALYEAKMGISPALAGALGLPAGASFHFTLNDSIYSDTRIPPLGFTNAGFESFGGQPVDPEAPGIRYADGQNWDAPQYHLPTETDRVIATLYYQTTSKEYVDFLRDENTTDDRGTVLHDLWSSNGRSSPVVMVADTADVGVTAIPPALPFEEELSVSALQNPFRDRLVLRLRVPTPSEVIYRITDVSGRLVCERAQACSAGPIQIVWDGTDGAGRAVSSGLYWVNIRAGDVESGIRVVRVQ